MAALHEIERHLISGSILACITVLLFMRSWRSTFIAAVAVPASIIATFAFLPVSFLSSVTGRMLFQFGVTATVAILVSMLVSFSLTPMMCSKLLKPGLANPSGPASRRGFYRRLENAYLWMLGRVHLIISKPQDAWLSNVTFGGQQFDTPFVTCGDKVYKRKIKATGAKMTEPIKLPKARR